MGFVPVKHNVHPVKQYVKKTPLKLKNVFRSCNLDFKNVQLLKVAQHSLTVRQ